MRLVIAEKPSVAQSLAAVLAQLPAKTATWRAAVAGVLVPGASGRAGGRRRLQPRLRQVAL